MAKRILAWAASAGLLILGLAPACGSDKKTDETSTTAKLDFTKDINPIIVASCADAACHGKSGAAANVYEDNETTLKANKTDCIRRLKLVSTDPDYADFMPRGKTLSDANKQKLIDFLNQ